MTVWQILLGNENEYSEESVNRGIIGVGAHFSDAEVKAIIQKGLKYAKNLKRQKGNLPEYDLEIRFITQQNNEDFVFHSSYFFIPKNVVMLGKIGSKPRFFTSQAKGNWKTYFKIVSDVEEWKPIPFSRFSDEELQLIKYAKFQTFRRINISEQRASALWI